MLAPQLIAASLAASAPVDAPSAPTVEASVEQVVPAAPDTPPDPAAAQGDSAASGTASADAAPAADDFALDEVPVTKDPLEFFNRPSFAFSMAADKFVIRPAAMIYRTIVPKPGRDAIHNFQDNLGEPFVFLNDVLQLRPDRAVRTLARFVINTTLGIGGLVDPAKRKPFYLAHHGNGFSNTLGYYGVKPGPYIYLPILGPMTLRDVANRGQDQIPLYDRLIGSPFDRNEFNYAMTATDGIGQRERADDDLKAMFDGAVDRYATFRENYLQNRQGDIDWLKSADHGDVPHDHR